MEANPASHTPAHDVTATVAPFRAWRGSQLIIARGPTGPTKKQTTRLDAAHSPQNTLPRQPLIKPLLRWSHN